GRHGDAVFLVLYFLRNSDDHWETSISGERGLVFFDAERSKGLVGGVKGMDMDDFGTHARLKNRRAGSFCVDAGRKRTLISRSETGKQNDPPQSQTSPVGCPDAAKISVIQF
ncbi:MAG: hypothetical protein ABI579_05400, partial [Candidatus Sumerlaeota bacterium]